MVSQSGNTWRRVKPSPLFFQLVIVIFALAAVAWAQRDFDKPSTKSLHVGIDSQIMSHLTLGFNLMMADVFWVRVVQEIDYKDGKNVKEGWVFHMIDNVTTLDRRFKMAYDAGGTLLSVIIHDVPGAVVIFERARENFPNDWNLAYKAGYHYLYEVKDCQKAAECYERAVRNGAPKWVAALAGRLYTKSGQYELAKQVIVDTIEQTPEGSKFRDELVKRLKELQEMYVHSGNKESLIANLKCQTK